MDHIHQGSHTRQQLVDVMKGAFCKSGCENFEEIRGVAVMEPHSATGGFHLQGAVWCNSYHGPRPLLDRARKSDLDVRGWKRKPDVEQKTIKAGGKGKGGRTRQVERDKRGTGEPWHLSLLFHHVYSVSDKAVLSGKTRAGSFKQHWKFNEMVEYLVAPVKDKEIDDAPLYFNCDEDSIWLSEEENEGFNFPQLVQYARDLKKDGVHAGDVMQQVAEKAPTKGNSWMLQHVMQAWPLARARLQQLLLQPQLQLLFCMINNSSTLLCRLGRQRARLQQLLRQPQLQLLFCMTKSSSALHTLSFQLMTPSVQQRQQLKCSCWRLCCSNSERTI